jgi:hypothetical protein
VYVVHGRSSRNGMGHSHCHISRERESEIQRNALYFCTTSPGVKESIMITSDALEKRRDDVSLIYIAELKKPKILLKAYLVGMD